MAGGLKRIVSLLVVILTLHGLANSLPLSEMKHITLHVQSEILDGHKIVITLEPRESDDKKNLPVGLQEQLDLTQSSIGKSVQSADKTNGNTTTEAEEDSTTNSTEAPKMTTTKEAPGNGTEATPVTQAPGVIVSEVPSTEPGVLEFLLKLPDVKCPEGFRRDGKGKCRQILFAPGSRGLGKSLSRLNFIP